MAGVLEKLTGAASKFGSKIATMPTDEAAGIKATTDNVKDYMKSIEKEPPAPKAEPVVSDKDKLHPNSKYGDNPGEQRIDVSAMTKPLIQSYKKGTNYVPKTGLAILHKGEKVVPAKENKMDKTYDMVKGMAKDTPPKKEIKTMEHSKSHNGKHIVTHKHHSPAHHPDETHVMNDMAELHAHMDDHAGTPNEGEAAPTDGSAPAPLTAAPSPAPMAAPGA
jgi:hypothetical protein